MDVISPLDVETGWIAAVVRLHRRKPVEVLQRFRSAREAREWKASVPSTFASDLVIAEYHEGSKDVSFTPTN